MVSVFKKYFLRSAIIVFWILFFATLLFLVRLGSVRSSERTLRIFAWAGMFDAYQIREFEQKTGIRVSVSYYESNEELLIKLRATGAKGYDLIMPSDYALPILKSEGLIKKIEKNSIKAFNSILPQLRGHYFDPHNEYSIPFEWSIFGIAFDRTFFNATAPKPSWSIAFTNPKSYCVIMTNDPLVAIPLGAFYLYHRITGISQNQLLNIQTLLQRQRSWVEVYTDFRADTLLAQRACPVAVTTSSYAWRGMRVNSAIEFLIPQEGTMLTIENFALPCHSQQDEYAYAFINFMLSKKMINYNFFTLGYFPSIIKDLDLSDVPSSIQQLFLFSPEEFKQFHLLQIAELNPSITEQDLQQMWVVVKS